MRKIGILFGIAILSIFLNGCASFTMLSKGVKNNVRTVNVSGTPDKSKVYLNDEFVGNSPCDVRVKRIYKKNTIKVENTDYVTQELKVKRKLRPFWLVTDIVPGALLLGIPLIVDFASGSMFKVDPQLSFTLKYSEIFYQKEFQKIELSRKPDDFKSYIQKYPESNYKVKAQVKVDSLDYIAAIDKKSDFALEEYINSHPNSKFNSEARSIKEQLFEARTAFETAVQINTEKAYVDFINQYPNSFYKQEAVEKLINVAEINSHSKHSSEAIYSFIEKVLFKYTKSGDNLRTMKLNSSIPKLQAMLVEETLNFNGNDWDRFSELWKKVGNYEYQIKNRLDKVKSEFIPKTLNVIFKQINNTLNATQQDSLIQKAIKDFPDVIPYSEVNAITELIEKNPYKNGNVILYKNSYILSSFYKSYRRSEFEKEFISYLENLKTNYEDNKFVYWHNVYDKNFTEYLIFKQGKLHGEQKGMSGAMPIYSINYEDGVLNGNATVYKEGKIHLLYNYSKGYLNYFYEYANGKNLSLQNLNEQISLAEKEFKLNNYDEALSIYQNDCKNNYPKDIEQNVRIQKGIEQILMRRMKIAEETAKKEAKEQEEKNKKYASQKQNEQQDKSSGSNSDGIKWGYVECDWCGKEFYSKNGYVHPPFQDCCEASSSDGISWIKTSIKNIGKARLYCSKKCCFEESNKNKGTKKKFDPTKL